MRISPDDPGGARANTPSPGSRPEFVLKLPCVNAEVQSRGLDEKEREGWRLPHFTLLSSKPPPEDLLPCGF